MKKTTNVVQLQTRRQLDSRYNSVIQEQLIVTPNSIKRLGLLAELDGHTGCVNCLDWSHEGDFLLSGSDDVQIILWDAFRRKQLATIPTGHVGNIFTVKFLPNSSNGIAVSGAADHAVRVHDIINRDSVRVCNCHTNRVKRCDTDPSSSNLFWTAGEDGLIIQHDLRSSHTCPSPESTGSRNALIDLKSFLGSKAEAKCLSVNPLKSDYIAVGANDPYVRLYDRRYIKIGSNSGFDNGILYFVPGHLPSKFIEYKRKYRALASTYVTFSPDGKELLANLGGEQIYLFPLIEQNQSKVCNLVVPETQCLNGVKDFGANGFKNGTTNPQPVVIAARLDLTCGMRRIKKPKEKARLSLAADELKLKANDAFQAHKYAKAVYLYNLALNVCRESAVLYGNRSAALLKRAWDGDTYAAFLDCQTAFYLDSNHFKALLRMSRCLLELGRSEEAAACFKHFKHRFPEHIKTDMYLALQKDLLKTFSESELSGSESAILKSLIKPPIMLPSSPIPTMEIEILTPSQRQSFSDNSDDSEADGDDEETEASSSTATRSTSSDSSGASTTTKDDDKDKPRPEMCELELEFRDQAVDFLERFCGHCNTTTDIKEANFFGEYIVAGSDDGSFFIWDKKTTNIVKIIKGDESIVNCLQPHPSSCLLATSGIESFVRLWSPMPEEGFENDRVVEDINDAAYANQKRMNANPFEVILMNMGYRVSGSGASDEASDEDTPNVPLSLPCNPS